MAVLLLCLLTPHLWELLKGEHQRHIRVRYADLFVVLYPYDWPITDPSHSYEYWGSTQHEHTG